jgi:hypothetical protein
MRDRPGHRATRMFDAILALPLELYQAERESSHRYAVVTEVAIRAREEDLSGRNARGGLSIAAQRSSAPAFAHLIFGSSLLSALPVRL